MATLRLVQAPGFYARLEVLARRLTEGLSASAKKHGVTFSAQSVGGMFGVYFGATPPTSYAEVMACDAKAFNRFKKLLETPVGASSKRLIDLLQRKAPWEK